jgi:hypothetical protein
MLSREREIVDQLGKLGERGVKTTLLTDRDGTVDVSDAVSVVKMPDDNTEDTPTGRILAVDETALLLSVVTTEDDGQTGETAIWSAETDFAHVLIQLFEGWISNQTRS